MKKIKFIITAIIFILNSVAFSQTEGDRVLAIAGNYIITESDFQNQLQMYAKQNQLNEISPYIAQQLFQSILTNKILLAKADQDSIEVTEDEITREYENRIKSLIDQVGSQQRLEELYGMPMNRIKSTLKEELKKNLKVEKLKRKKFSGGVNVSEREVNEFYTTYKDSLPEVSEEFEIAHIFMERKMSDAEKSEAKRIAELILDSIKSGGNFSELAKRNSADSMSAIQGGDLGFAKKGTFVKEFEETVFNLKEGEVSEIVETQFGYHIIKLTERQGDKVRSSHILVRYPKFESSDFETINFLKDLKSSIEKGETTFEEAAKKYSLDNDTKQKSGYIGRVPEEQIDSNSLSAFKNLSPGQITEPIRTGGDDNYGYEIYKLIKVFPAHKINLTEDYDKIKRFAENLKESREMEQWINKIKESVYVDIKIN